MRPKLSLIGACEKRNSSCFILARPSPFNSLIINQLMKRSEHAKAQANPSFWPFIPVPQWKSLPAFGRGIHKSGVDLQFLVGHYLARATLSQEWESSNSVLSPVTLIDWTPSLLGEGHQDLNLNPVKTPLDCRRRFQLFEDSVSTWVNYERFLSFWIIKNIKWNIESRAPINRKYFSASSSLLGSAQQHLWNRKFFPSFLH